MLLGTHVAGFIIIIIIIIWVFSNARWRGVGVGLEKMAVEGREAVGWRWERAAAVEPPDEGLNVTS